MKVLNWVTRRFLNNVQSCIAVLPDEDMEDDDVNSKHDIDETKRPMLEEWDDRLLTIGTLAIDPLETGNFEIIEEIKNTKEETPLMNNVTLFTHELDKNKIPAKTETTKEQVVNDVVELDDNDDEIDNKDEGRFMKRVTLADLLLEGSNHELVKQFIADNKQLHSKDVITMSKPSLEMSKPIFRAKKGLAKAKKLLKEDLSPVKKLNQLMKRMMGKKIHPDMEGKTMQDMNMQPTRPNWMLDPIYFEHLLHGTNVVVEQIMICGRL